MANRTAPQGSTSNKRNVNLPSEAQLHYESLTSAFRWMVGIGGAFLLGCAAVVTALTYSKFSDLAAEIKESKAEARTELNELRKEAKEVEQSIRLRMDGTSSELTNEVSSTLTKLTREVSNTQNASLQQISRFQTFALAEAKAKIEEVYKEKNLEVVVEDIVKNRLESRMVGIADRAFEQGEKTKIDKAIRDLKSNDVIISNNAWFYLSNSAASYQFDDNQLDGLFEIINDPSQSSNIKEGIINFFWTRRSPRITKFFEEVLGTSKPGNGYALGYLLNYSQTTNISLFERYILSSSRKGDTFLDMISNGMSRPTLVLQFLNSRPIVDGVFKESNSVRFDQIRTTVKSTISNKISLADFNNSYLSNIK